MKYDIIADNIIQWLKAYSKKSKTDGFVIGISGGIDSALTSTLCASTGPANNMHRYAYYAK